MKENESGRCSVKGCTFPEGKCTLLEGAIKTAENGNFEPLGWAITKDNFFKQLANSGCADAKESAMALEKVSPTKYVFKKEKIS